jgi:hypothetical protein
MHYLRTGIDMQPIRDLQLWWYYVYLVFILLGNFIGIQLFVGVMVNSFNESKLRVSGNLFLTEQQQEWLCCIV